jgi:hypothetical protein
MRCSTPLFVLLAAPALSQVPLPEIGTLTLPGNAANERAGDVLELDSVHAIVGAPFRVAAGSQQGAVVVFPRSGSGFGAATTLHAPTVSPGGQFGGAIALEGNELVVTERTSLHFGTPARGAFHRYALVGGVWTFLEATPNPSFGSSNGFGWSVDRSGDVVVVGAPFAVVSAQARGAVYVFRLVGGQWQQEAMLSASDGTSGDRFGDCVAVSGDRVVVGAPWRFVGGQQVGAAYAFELQAGAWVETAQFVPDPATSDRALGVAVDIDGARAAIGAARTNDRGATYVYADGGPTWALEERLQPANLGTFATFGDAVALLGDTLVVGAYQDTALGWLTGAAWVFERSGGAWVPVVRLAPSSSGPAFHGKGVALDGAGTFLVGEPNRTPTGGPTTAGVVHQYSLDRPLGTSYCAAVVNSTNRRGGIAALGSDVAAADMVTLVAYDLPFQAFGYFVTSRTQGTVQQPGGSQGVLCLGGAIGRYVGPGQVKNTQQSGVFALPLDLAVTPQPTGAVGIAAGETWNFQAWHRDAVGGVSTSNFSNAVTVTFQ